MKVVIEKKFILSSSEKQALEAYSFFLTKNVLPCRDCAALKNGKCEGHTFWESECNETCPEYVEWFVKGEPERVRVLNMPDELKKIVECHSLLSECANEIRDKSLSLAMAKKKLEECSVITRFEVGDYEEVAGRDLWEERTTEEGS